MDGLAIRKAVQTDVDFTFAVKEAAFRENVEKVWGWDGADQRELHELRFASQDVHIIQYQGIDVGYFSTSATADRVRINQIFILPEYQRKGLGSACMRLIVSDARAQKKVVRLQVLKINTRAIAFYDRLGFSIVDEDDTHVQMEILTG
ncbi:MAG: N-acetyltransferase [Gemmatimonadetes bacterium]|nr:N-acetyltransferase [Gemmatimonadota bacterium]